MVSLVDNHVDEGSAGKLLIDMSTMDANHTRELAGRLRSQCGMGWLDAPISGGPPAAAEGRMAVMVGGRFDLIETGELVGQPESLGMDRSAVGRIQPEVARRHHQ